MRGAARARPPVAHAGRWQRVPGSRCSSTTAAQASPPATPQAHAGLGDLARTSLTPTGQRHGDEDGTSSLAETDPALLGRTDATPIAVVVKLDYDSVATYDGSVPGPRRRRSPAVTGQRPAGDVRRPSGVRPATSPTRSRLQPARWPRAVPTARLGQSLRTVYGGVALTVPANEIGDVLALPGVVAVQRDELRQPLTDSSPSFIGADTLYPELGGTADAGKGVIVGVLDTGAWPEHPSFADQGNLAAPPARADGTPRAATSATTR